MSTPIDLSVLHSHYQDTAQIVRTCEKQRNRLFFLLVAVIGALALQLEYSVRLSDLVEMVGVGRTRIDLRTVPRQALLSATWILFSFVVLRYYQTTLHVEKQYDYIHSLECRLSECLGHSDIISRESSAYETKKGSVFRHWTWISFTIAYPFLILGVVVYLQISEWRLTLVPVSHRVFDLVVAVVGSAAVVCYLIAIWIKK